MYQQLFISRLWGRAWHRYGHQLSKYKFGDNTSGDHTRAHSGIAPQP